MLGRDKVCAVIAAPRAAAMSGQLARALRETRTVELRLDWLCGDAEIAKFLRQLEASRPQATLIATCRRREAGGRYRGTIAQQLVHLAEAIRVGCQWYDFEIEGLRKCPRELLAVLLHDAKQLASAHFFGGIPKSLPRVARELNKYRPDAIKIAAQCDSLAQARALLDFGRKNRNLVAIPMGDVGLPTRFLAMRSKRAFMYAPVDVATAPGQISLDEMKRVYRADRFNARTRIYGVIGNPIGHSLSPAMQNAGFAARRMNAVYLPFRVRDLRDFLASIASLGIAGFSVTLPHKERILGQLDACDPLAIKIGAVNTVVVRDGGKLYGYNTDYAGVLRSLERRMLLRGSRVLLLGAGGAARAVAFALSEAGSAVCVWARRADRAKSLARAVNGEAILRPGLRGESFDAIVNATPVGMYPYPGASPLDARELNCRLVFDTIYRPRKTRLLQLAERQGIDTVSGVEMFVAQGTAQWELWTGERAPVAAMRRSLEDALRREELAANRSRKKRGTR
jgi:3-dehydroquinate dehydratase / shikimate dehydrogenase